MAPRSSRSRGNGGPGGGGGGERLSPGPQRSPLSDRASSFRPGDGTLPSGAAELRALQTAAASDSASQPRIPRSPGPPRGAFSALGRGQTPESLCPSRDAKAGAEQSAPLGAHPAAPNCSHAPPGSGAAASSRAGPVSGRGHRASGRSLAVPRAVAAATRGAPRAANLAVTSTARARPAPGRARPAGGVGWRKGGADLAAAAQRHWRRRGRLGRRPFPIPHFPPAPAPAPAPAGSIAPSDRSWGLRRPHGCLTDSRSRPDPRGPDFHPAGHSLD